VARWIVRDTAATNLPSSMPSCSTFCDDLHLSEHRPMPGQPSSREMWRQLNRQAWKARVKAKLLPGVKALGRISAITTAGVVGWQIGTALRPLFYSTAVPQPISASKLRVREWIPYEEGEHTFNITDKSGTPHDDFKAPADGYVAYMEHPQTAAPMGDLQTWEEPASSCPSRLEPRPDWPISASLKGSAPTVFEWFHPDEYSTLCTDPTTGYKWDQPYDEKSGFMWVDFEPQPIRELAPDDIGPRVGTGTANKGQVQPPPQVSTAIAAGTTWPQLREQIITDVQTTPQRAPIREVVTWVDSGMPESEDPYTTIVIPEPEPGDTAATYTQRLVDEGLQGQTTVLTDASIDTDVGPDEVSRTRPRSGTRVAPGTTVEVFVNPSTAPEATTGPNAEPGCAGVTVPALSLDPLRIGLPDRFPFAVFGWLANTLGGWAGGGALPTLDIPIPYVDTPMHIDVSWAMDPMMAVLRPLLLILSLLGLAWLFASSALGFGGGNSDD
jgi:hypothetical protein